MAGPGREGGELGGETMSRPRPCLMAPSRSYTTRQGPRSALCEQASFQKSRQERNKEPPKPKPVLRTTPPPWY